MIIYYLCSITSDFLTAVERNSHRGLSRRLYYHKGLRPKYQYCYHWFKVRMKQKKTRKFRKPKPLFHLTTKGKLIIGIYLFVIRLHRVGCRVSNQIKWLCSCLRSFFYPKPKRQCDILKCYLSNGSPLAPMVVAYTATAAGQKPRCFHGQFDTDSF